MQAALDGSSEIGFAVIATTITLVAVFVPLAFLTGSVGRLFNEFGVTLAVAVLISGFVALTLTPMLCSKILKPLHGAGTGWAVARSMRSSRCLNRCYDRTLRFALRRPVAYDRAAALRDCRASACFVFSLLPSELVPIEDRGIGVRHRDRA